MADFKWLLWGLLALAMLVGGAVGIGLGYQWYTQDRHEAKVIVTVDASNDGCKTKEHPLYVVIDNKSELPIHKFSFYLSARRPDRSSDITNYQHYSDDYIISAGKKATACFAPPSFKEAVADPKALIWSVSSKIITFGK